MKRTPEQRLWDNFKVAVGGQLLLYRVENSAGEAMPDVIGINRNGEQFFIENKAIVDWPKRAATFPLRGKFEKGQLSFARQWNGMRGNCFVLFRVGTKEWLLLREILITGYKPLDQMTKAELYSSAIMIGRDEIIDYLEKLKK